MASPGLSYAVAFEALNGVYLEDSWVLSVQGSQADCRFELDVVLTPQHRSYSSPRPGEQYCYRRATLLLTSLCPISYQPSEAPPAMDASGERDLGNIDSFTAVDWDGRDAWQLAGEWGEMTIANPSVQLHLWSTDDAS